MKILVTGSNGLLGQKLTNLLAPKKEIELIATARGTDRYPRGKYQYTYASMDITDPRQVMDVISEHQPQVVINTAAMTNVDQCESEQEGCWALNVEAVKNLIAACEANDVFLLHLSTDFIFDGENGPYSEDDEAKPVSYYGDSKLAAENLLKESNLSWAIARTVLVYGIAHDMSRSNIILWVKNSLESQKNIRVVNDQWRTPTLAEDLAMGCYLIAVKKAEGIYNISGEDLLNPYQMAVMTADFFSLDKSLIEEVDASVFTQAAKRPPKTGFIIDKAKKILGYQPVSFRRGIEILSEQITQFQH
ncbi:MAG: SDR family oxidoreductase [Bacteroidota bacterium]